MEKLPPTTRSSGRNPKRLNYQNLHNFGFEWDNATSKNMADQIDKLDAHLQHSSHQDIIETESGLVEKDMSPEATITEEEASTAESLLALSNLSEEEIKEQLAKAKEEEAKLVAEQNKRDNIIALLELQQRNQARCRNIEMSDNKISCLTTTKSTVCSSASQHGQGQGQGARKKESTQQTFNINSIRANKSVSHKVDHALEILGLDQDSDSEDEVRSQRVKSRGKKINHLKTKSSKRQSLIIDSDEEDNTVIWPHELLGPKFSDYSGSNTIKYKQLDSRLFIAGELSIIKSRKISEFEKCHRLNLLFDTVFNMAFYEWPALLKLHAAILTEIESGSMYWDSDFSRLEQQLLMPFPLKKVKKTERVKPQSDKRNDEERVIFCNLFQKGSCTFSELSHTAKFFGRSTTVHHICAKCWQKSKSRQYHPESSPECPNSEN